MESEPDAITVLTVSRQLLATKSYFRDLDGAVTKMPTKMAKRFRVTSRPFNTIFDLADILADLNAAPRSFAIRGEPMPGVDLSAPVRRLKYSGPGQPATFRSSETGRRWICFDFDKVAAPVTIDARANPARALDYLAGLLPAEFHNVTYWGQWSSSAGIKGWSSLSAHLWFVLDQPISDDDLWLWGQSTAAPIDTRLFNSVQPHFTAAPIFAFDVPDPCPSRHHLIKKEYDVAALRPAETNGCGRAESRSRETRLHPVTVGDPARPARREAGSPCPQMGSGRTYHRSGSDSGAVLPETPLLSERLIMQFRQRLN